MKKNLRTILTTLFVVSLLSIALGETLDCMKCSVVQCNSVENNNNNCGRTIICTGSCKRGTTTTSYALCVPGGLYETCEKIGVISCGKREISPCSGWPSCTTCNNYEEDGIDLYVSYC